MANISDAYGTACFVADTPEDVVWLRDLYAGICAKFEYYTDFSKLDYEPVLNGEKYESECSFIACGRWTFENNISLMTEWVISTLEEQGRRADAERLSGTVFRISFDYTDYEPGCEVLYQAYASIWHDRDGTDYEIANYDGYDITPENLVKLGFYDSIEEAKEFM